MIRRFVGRFPGAPVVQWLIFLVLVAVALIALGFLFEWAGDLLDSGGVIGPAG